MIDGGAAERFSRGEAVRVDPGAIEKELAALWQTAAVATAQREPGRVLSRAALWNLVVPWSGAAPFAETKGLVDALSPVIPARVIVLREETGDGPELEATVESNVVSRSGGARLVSSEEITLTVRGAGGEHLPSLVRSLLVPDLPTAVLWTDIVPSRKRITWDLAMQADRVVVDTGLCGDPGDLAAVADLAALAGAPLADLSWIRLTTWRLLFAGLFGPPVGGRPLLTAESLHIRHAEGRPTGALLLLAWLVHALDWRAPHVTRERRALRIRFARNDGSPVEVVVESVDDDGGRSGVIATEVVAQGARYGVRRRPGGHAELTLPIAPPQIIKLDSPAPAELVRLALGPKGRDPLFRDVLAGVTALGGIVGAAA